MDASGKKRAATYGKSNWEGEKKKKSSKTNGVKNQLGESH